MIDPDELMEYANSLKSGYMKHSKAVGMCLVFNGQPSLLEDSNRLLDYVTNCLGMEGFDDGDIYEVTAWIIIKAVLED